MDKFEFFTIGILLVLFYIPGKLKHILQHILHLCPNFKLQEHAASVTLKNRFQLHPPVKILLQQWHSGFHCLAF